MSPLKRLYTLEGAPEPKAPAPEEMLAALDDPERYLPDPGLEDAVNVALLLQRPLLLTGDPGSGKTALAGSVSRRLGRGDPLVFYTKTTSTAKELFYRYDALRHFRDVQIGRAAADGAAVDKGTATKADSARADAAKASGATQEARTADSRVAPTPAKPLTQPKASDYIEYEALGKAIIMASAPQKDEPPLPDDIKRRDTASVVLIDEVDKAPRDLPNDVLREIDRMEFDVLELERKHTFKAVAGRKPLVIFTSNTEKNLPDPFLRRCIFYHVPFPKPDKLRTIVRWRLGLHDEPGTRDRALLTFALREFEAIRNAGLNKSPSIAELLDWLRVLRELNVQFTPDGYPIEPDGDGGRGAAARRDSIAMTYAVLAKSRQDVERVEALLRRDAAAAAGG